MSKIKIPVVIKERENSIYEVGDVLNYVNSTDEQYIEMKDNFIFDELLRVSDIQRGKSSATFKLESLDGKVYTMFMKDMLDMIQSSNLKDGWIAGEFTYCKRGTNYGIKLVKQEIFI